LRASQCAVTFWKDVSASTKLIAAITLTKGVRGLVVPLVESMWGRKQCIVLRIEAHSTGVAGQQKARLVNVMLWSKE